MNPFQKKKLWRRGLRGGYKKIANAVGYPNILIKCLVSPPRAPITLQLCQMRRNAGGLKAQIYPPAHQYGLMILDLNHKGALIFFSELWQGSSKSFKEILLSIKDSIKAINCGSFFFKSFLVCL